MKSDLMFEAKDQEFSVGLASLILFSSVRTYVCVYKYVCVLK